jgi:hypothetical protein
MHDTEKHRLHEQAIIQNNAPYLKPVYLFLNINNNIPHIYVTVNKNPAK